ncbi:MAG: hypothetical protein WBE89_10765 [Methyloceanibacter sp.]|jgi:hypothetical protein
MPRLVVAALALMACGFGNEAFAQSPGNTDANGSAALPTLILPNTLTSPLTSGLDPKGHGATSAPPGGETPDAASEAPSSVEGEETLDPDTN